MTIIGVLYMLFLALKMMTSKSDDQNNSEDKHNGFLIGMLLQFINPKGSYMGLPLYQPLSSHTTPHIQV